MARASQDHFFRHTLQPGRLVRERDAQLVQVAAGRRVVHVGCVDWPVTDLRLRDGSLLHPKLMAAADDVIGVDIDEPGLQALEQSLGGRYLSIDVTDAACDLSEIEAFSPDVIIAGDVIEHVPSAQGFLEGLGRIAALTHSSVVITTPNSLAFRSTVNTLVGVELMHPDHVAIYSPMTLRTLIERSGLTVVSWEYYTINTGSDLAHRTYDAVSRGAARVRGAWADGHIVTCAVTADA